jgi:predicted DNA-binding protein with PD1-like motif
MKFSEAKQGRTFVIRLEDGEIVHEEIERFARDQNISAAYLTILGGADQGSRLVTGPEQGRGVTPIVATTEDLPDVHELVGTGTLFPDDTGTPVLHMHMACGRRRDTVTGCIREGVKVWQVMEVVLVELTDTSAVRMPDPETGFKLLQP